MVAVLRTVCQKFAGGFKLQPDLNAKGLVLTACFLDHRRVRIQLLRKRKQALQQNALLENMHGDLCDRFRNRELGFGHDVEFVFDIRNQLHGHECRANHQCDKERGDAENLEADIETHQRSPPLTPV